MNELAFSYSIRSELPPKSESPAALGAKFIETLDALSRIDPAIFADWEVMDYPARSSIPLAAARSRIAAIIEKNAHDDDFRPRPEWGYTAGAFTGSPIESRRISLRIPTGGTQQGDTLLKMGDYKSFPDAAIVTYPVFKAALLALNAIWPPRWACAFAFRVDYFEVPLFPGASLFPYSDFHIPWLAYVSSPLAAGLKLAPEILTERTADGGLLMIATEERLDPTHPEHLRCARILAETMMACTGHGSTSLEDMARAQIIGDAIRARADRSR
jgi:hypothetical protein